MGKIQPLVTILLLTAGSGIVEGHATKQGDALYERFVNYGLRSQTDSIYAGKDKALAYFAEHHQWEYYYYVANLAIQMKVLREDQPMAGLRECRELYNFAIGHHHDYGRASVLAQMGWLYGYIGDHAEAAAQLKESLGELRRHKPTLAILGIYYIYAYMLELTHDYDEELRVVEEGKQLWTQLSNDIDTTSLAYRTVHDNLLNVETLMEVRRGNLDKAGILVARLEHKLATNNEMTRYEALRAIAEYYLARKDYEKALAVTDEMQQMSSTLNSGLRWGLNLLRTEIIRNLGRSDEAYDTLRQMMERRNSSSVSQLRRQLSEMDSQYQLDAMRIQEQKNHFWYAVSVSLLIIIGLLVFAYFRQRAARLLARKNEELAAALEHAQESDRMKTAFVQHISHEIRTPLNIITGFAQVISNPDYEVSEEDRNRMLADIGHNTEEITNFVNELLELSESESQSQYAKDDDVDVAALCRSVVADYEQQNAGHLQISVESSLPEGFTIRSNANALSKILARLMSNALKFTEQGRVTVRLYEAGGLLKIEVEDTGIGIPPEHQEKIFERFYKVDTFKQGIGLGLTVARRATELLGGTLTLDGNYTAGARFVVTLTDPSAQASRRASN